MASYDDWPLARFPAMFFKALEDDGGAFTLPEAWNGSTARIAWYSFLKVLRRHPRHPLYEKSKTYWYVRIRNDTLTAIPKVKADDPGFSDQGAAMLAAALGLPAPHPRPQAKRDRKRPRKHRYSFLTEAELDEPLRDGKGEPE